MKYFTAEEVADLILSSNSTRTSHFYGGKLPRGDHEIGSNYIDDEVIYIMENGGGMRCTSFCAKIHYDEGILQSEYPLPSRDKLISDIKSNAGFHGSLVEMRTGRDSTILGQVKSPYRERKKNANRWNAWPAWNSW